MALHLGRITTCDVRSFLNSFSSSEEDFGRQWVTLGLTKSERRILSRLPSVSVREVVESIYDECGQTQQETLRILENLLNERYPLISISPSFYSHSVWDTDRLRFSELRTTAWYDLLYNDSIVQIPPLFRSPLSFGGFIVPFTIDAIISGTKACLLKTMTERELYLSCLSAPELNFTGVVTRFEPTRLLETQGRVGTDGSLLLPYGGSLSTVEHALREMMQRSTRFVRQCVLKNQTIYIEKTRFYNEVAFRDKALTRMIALHPSYSPLGIIQSWIQRSDAIFSKSELVRSLDQILGRFRSTRERRKTTVLRTALAFVD